MQRAIIWPEAALTVNLAGINEYHILNLLNLGGQLWPLGQTWPTICFHT